MGVVGFLCENLEWHRVCGMCDMYGGGVTIGHALATKVGEFIGNVIIHDA